MTPFDKLRDRAQKKLCRCDFTDPHRYDHGSVCPMRYFNDFAQAVGLEQLVVVAEQGVGVIDYWRGYVEPPLPVAQLERALDLLRSSNPEVWT